MTYDRNDIEAGAAWARKTLGKDASASATEPKASEAERIKAWSAKGRAAEGTQPAQTRAAVLATRHDLHTPGTAYQVGSERYAADGSLWRRTA